MASPEETIVYTATLSKMDHWSRSTVEDRFTKKSVRNRKLQGTGSYRRNAQHTEGNNFLV
jgi:stalled ribosome alternative rescue factor ArfA